MLLLERGVGRPLDAGLEDGLYIYLHPWGTEKPLSKVM